MKAVSSGRWSVVGVCCLLLSAFWLAGCSIPNLEPPECDQARDVIREFYSFHFGSDMVLSDAELEKRKEFLTPRFYGELKSKLGGDPFTMHADDLPKAFRVSRCFVAEPGRRVRLNVLLFWKTDTRTEEKTIGVEAENIDGRWLIDSVRENLFLGPDDI